MTADQGLAACTSTPGVRSARLGWTMNLVPDEVQSASCRLYFGGRGTQSVAEGTLDTTTFRIHSGTWPYFGTVTAAPQTGIAIADPGCVSGGVGGVAFRTHRAPLPQPCQGRESIASGSAFGTHVLAG